MEKCTNCKRVIGNLETPMIYKGKHIVCEGCHAKLTGVPVLAAKATDEPKELEIMDKIGGMPTKPKMPFFTMTKQKQVALKRVKLVCLDEDTGTEETPVIEVNNDVLWRDMIKAVESETGKKVTKIVVLQRFWKMVDADSKLEKAVGALAFLSLLD